MNGNIRAPRECPYCWRVLYSQGALTNHVNNEHWKEKELEEAEAKLASDDQKEVNERP